MFNLWSIAYYILQKCGKMSTFKLHKLLYYCQAWYMAWNNGRPLFQEDFEAWVNGPVIRELFNSHKGMYDIDEKTIKIQYVNDINNNIDTETKEQINRILFFYNKKSSLSLVSKSHSELPWQKARKGINSLDLSDNIINKKDIYEYYKDKNITELSME